MRLIDADALREMCDSPYWCVWLSEIDDAPTIEAEPIKHGRWELRNDGSGTCSECHFTQKNVWDYDSHQNYCGVCGAKMDLEEERWY